MVPKLIINPDLNARITKINEILEQYNLSQYHPNMLWYQDEEKLGITQTRKIIEHLSLKPYQQGGQGVVIVSADDLTDEAQNALLKTLEEPPIEAIIVLGASSAENFLPTILSRCQLIQAPESVGVIELTNKVRSEIEGLISSSVEDRFKFVEKLDDKQIFLENLTTYFRSKLTDNPKPDDLLFIEELIRAQRWAKQNVNLRAIVEYIMLKIPVTAS